MNVSFDIPIKKHLVRLIEFKRKKNSIPGEVSIYQMIEIEQHLVYIIGSLHYLFEGFSGYYIHREILIDSFIKNKLFKRIKRPTVSIQDNFDDKNYTILRFTFTVKKSRNYKPTYTKNEAYRMINKYIEQVFWRIAISTIFLMQFEKSNIKVDKAIKIFYNYIKLPLNEYKINTFKRMLYIHKFNLLQKDFPDVIHFSRYLSRLQREGKI